MRVSIATLLIQLLLLVASTFASDWPRFRGPNGCGISTDSASVPVRWSPDENLKWAVELPGPRSSRPIVIGERIFVIGWTGYGISEDQTEAPASLQRHLICVDRMTCERILN